MATNIGPRIGIDGEAEYRKQIQNIIQQQKTLKSEMEASVSAFNKDADSKKKNAKQIETLNKQIELQKERVKELSEMAEKSAKQSGENSTATLKWRQAVADATTELNRMNDQLKELTGPSGAEALAASLDAAGKKLQDIGGTMTKVGTSLTKSVTAPIVGLGAAAVAAFNEVDAAEDQIIKMTGASGDALDGLVKSFQNVSTTIPVSMDTASAAIGEINTRFGATGSQLEELSTDFLRFAELNGTDVTSSVDSVQKVMAAYGLSIEDTGAVLDTLNKVGQDTGISVSTLSSLLITNGSALRGLGMNAADSAVLLGQLEKSGVDTSAVMTGLAKVQQNAAKNNTTMAQSLAKALESSEGAIDVFGAKAGPKLYEAFQSGTLTVDMFTGGMYELNDALGNVQATYEATLDPMDQATLTWNQLKITGAEFGATMMNLIAPALQTVGQWVKQLSEWVNGLDENQKKQIVTIGAVIAAVGPVVTIIGKVTTGIGSILSIGSKLIPFIAGLNPVVLAVTAVIAGLVAAGVYLYKNWDTVKEKAAALKASISEAWGNIKAKTSETWESIKTKISTTIESAKEKVRSAIERIKSFFHFSWSLPSIKLPHFSISGGFSIMPPSVPHISVSWYRKAYDNAIGFTSPTVIPTSSGLKGFGDGPGTEIVIGQNTLMRTISGAVQNAFGYFPEQGSSSLTFGDNVINIYGAPGQDVEELAEAVGEILDAKVRQAQEVFA